MFPALQSMTVHTDGTPKPSTSLFDIGQDCFMSPAHLTEVRFLAVGCLIAKTCHGSSYTMTVEYKKLTELWEEIDEMSPESFAYVRHSFRLWPDESLFGRVVRTYFGREQVDRSDCECPFEPPEEFVRLLTKYCPAFRVSIYHHEFCTAVASPYSPYRTAVHNGQ
jgi:hypothetical protein